jgi:hypothetical protein
VKRTACRPQKIDISTAIAAFVRHDAPMLRRKKNGDVRGGVDQAQQNHQSRIAVPLLAILAAFYKFDFKRRYKILQNKLLNWCSLCEYLAIARVRCLEARLALRLLFMAVGGTHQCGH